MAGGTHLRTALLGAVLLIGASSSIASTEPRARVPRATDTREVVLTIRPVGARRTFCAHVSGAQFVGRRNVFRVR